MTFALLASSLGVVFLCIAIIWRNARQELDQPQPSERVSTLQIAESLQTSPTIAPLADFDSFMAQKAEEAGAKWLHASIAGVTFTNRDDTLRQPYVSQLKPFEELVLRPEPDNPHSKTAVAIFNHDGHQLGYVPEFLCGDIFRALTKKHATGAYVDSVGETGEGLWGASVGILWSLQADFEVSLERMLKDEADEWFWAKLTGITKKDWGGFERQAAIMNLKPKDLLGVGEDVLNSSERVLLSSEEGDEIATLSKQQSARVLDGLSAGRKYIGLVSNIKMRDDGVWEPSVAIVRLRHQPEVNNAD